MQSKRQTAPQAAVVRQRERGSQGGVRLLINCFPSDRTGEHITVFTAVDQWTQSPLAISARAKGRADEYVVRAFLGFIDQLG
eukprot:4979124-Amphidinium_carterae.2